MGAKTRRVYPRAYYNPDLQSLRRVRLRTVDWRCAEVDLGNRFGERLQQHMFVARCFPALASSQPRSVAGEGVAYRGQYPSIYRPALETVTPGVRWHFLRIGDELANPSTV